MTVDPPPDARGRYGHGGAAQTEGVIVARLRRPWLSWWFSAVVGVLLVALAVEVARMDERHRAGGVVYLGFVTLAVGVVPVVARTLVRRGGLDLTDAGTLELRSSFSVRGTMPAADVAELRLLERELRVIDTRGRVRMRLGRTDRYRGSGAWDREGDLDAFAARLGVRVVRE